MERKGGKLTERRGKDKGKGDGLRIRIRKKDDPRF